MVHGVNHITFSVQDLERSFRFYTEVLGLQPVARWYKGAHLLAGSQWICLNVEAELKDRLAGAAYDHVAFAVAPDDFASSCEKIKSSGVPQWQQNHSEGDSFYFLDPDNHKLEIHVTSLQDRIASLRKSPPKDLVLYP